MMIGNSDTANDISHNELELDCEDVLAAITDDVILGLCFEVHRAVKLNFFFLDEGKEEEEKFEIVDGVGQDIFGQCPSAEQFECKCPKCGYYLAAQKFAPHLEKCLKRGRKSFLNANEKIFNVEVEEYDNDSDWNSKVKKGTRKKKVKNSLKNSKKNRKNVRQTTKNGETGSNTATNGSSVQATDDMAYEETRTQFMKICGTISDRTNTMCAKSIRSSQHTNEQKRLVRLSVLGSDLIAEQSPDEVPIDVDTVDDGFWDQSISRITSSASSSASKRKDQKLFKM